MGRRRILAAFILYKTLGYPELGYNFVSFTQENNPVVVFSCKNQLSL